MKRNLLEKSFSQLKHEDAFVRKNAAQVIANFAPASEIARIQFALQNEKNIKVAKWLAFALAKIGDQRSLEAITAFLSTTNDPIERDWFILAQAILNKKSKSAEIKDLLKSKSVDGLKLAAQLLWAGRGDPTEELKKLIKLAEHDDSGIRRWSILAAGKAKLRTSDAIKNSLKDSDYLVREWTECSLANPAIETSPIILLPGLNDEHPRVREWAVKALAVTRRSEVPEILKSQLVNENDAECREAIYRSLATMKNVKDVPTILNDAVTKKVSPAELMAIIDLAISSQDARNDKDLLEIIYNACKNLSEPFLLSYFRERLFETINRNDQKAIQLLASSPSNIFLLEKIRETQKTNVNRKKKMKIGFIIALKEEFRAFAEIIGKLTPLNQSGHYKFMYTKNGLNIEGICRLVGDKGITRSLIATKDLISEFQPDLIINIGIAASIDNDLLLADVVAASQVTDYFHDSKIGDSLDGWTLNLSGDPYPINYGLLSKAINFEFVHAEEFAQWKQECSDNCNRLVELLLLESLAEQRQIRKTPDIIEAKIASGPSVVASPKFIAWLKTKGDRSFKALEMESAGVTAAANLAEISTPVFIVRGISDFADDRKNQLEEASKGAIRKLAMLNATGFVLRLIGQTILETKLYVS